MSDYEKQIEEMTMEHEENIASIVNETKQDYEKQVSELKEQISGM